MRTLVLTLVLIFVAGCEVACEGMSVPLTDEGITDVGMDVPPTDEGFTDVGMDVPLTDEGITDVGMDVPLTDEEITDVGMDVPPTDEGTDPTATCPPLENPPAVEEGPCPWYVCESPIGYGLYYWNRDKDFHFFCVKCKFDRTYADGRCLPNVYVGWGSLSPVDFCTEYQCTVALYSMPNQVIDHRNGTILNTHFFLFATSGFASYWRVVSVNMKDHKVQIERVENPDVSAEESNFATTGCVREPWERCPNDSQ